MSEPNLLTLTTDIISAHVGANAVAPSELPRMIASVHAALASLSQPGVAAAATEPAAPQLPAVSIRASLKPDSITCLECGSKQTMLRRHLMAAHDLSVDEYRAKWDLPSSYPMTAPNYAALRAEIAKKGGLGRGGPVRVKRAAGAR